jgi:multidrug efflux pump subunit AcrA (membrane-fusion protein)
VALVAGAAGGRLKTAPVELRDIELTTSAEAVVEAVRQSTVSAQIAGRIVELNFDVGDYVKKGAVIARIDERAVAAGRRGERGAGARGAGRARQRARELRALAPALRAEVHQPGGARPGRIRATRRRRRA